MIYLHLKQYSNNFVEFSPEDLLSFVEQKEKSGEFVNENELLPLYLRKSQAERMKDLK